MPAERQVNYRAYGLTISSDFELDHLLPLAPEGAVPDVFFECRIGGDPPRYAAANGEAPVYDRGSIRIWRRSGITTLEFGETVSHVVVGNRIICDLAQPEFDYLVPIQLLGMVLAVWLEESGAVVLHASAALVGEEAVVFMAGGKAGKTSLAAEFAAGGHPLITEDLAALQRDGGNWFVQPGYPMVRMWPQSVEHFVGDSGGLHVYHPAFEKLWVPVDRFGTFAERPAPVGVVYLPERTGGGEVSIHDVAPIEAVKAVLGGSYLADMMEPATNPGSRLDRVAGLIDGVVVRRLTYPSGMGRLSGVREAIFDDMGS